MKLNDTVIRAALTGKKLTWRPAPGLGIIFLIIAAVWIYQIGCM